jgi:hypothetical protein
MAETAADERQEAQNGTDAQEVALVPRSITQPARAAYDPRQVGLLKALSGGAPEPVFNQFLELSVLLDLNPFLGEIWLARMSGRDGEQGGYTVMVGRDGLLKNANRQGDFGGMRSAVVYSADEFDVWDDEETGHTKVKHVRHWVDAKDEQGEPILDSGVPRKTRGMLLGSWALVAREGKPPTYFFAEYAQYLPRSQAKRDKTPWSQFDDAMILKCSQSTALRMGYSVTGVVSADEVPFQTSQPGVGGEPVAGDVEWGDDAYLQQRLAALFAKANEIEPGEWLPKKIEVALQGKTDEQREALAEKIEGWIRERGGEVPVVPVPEEEHVEDADFEVIDTSGDHRRLRAGRRLQTKRCG